MPTARIFALRGAFLVMRARPRVQLCIFAIVLPFCSQRQAFRRFEASMRSANFCCVRITITHHWEPPCRLETRSECCVSQHTWRHRCDFCHRCVKQLCSQQRIQALQGMHAGRKILLGVDRLWFIQAIMALAHFTHATPLPAIIVTFAQYLRHTLVLTATHPGTARHARGTQDPARCGPP